MESTLVSVELIEVGARRRQLKEERVIALAKSIEENGLQTPITIVQINDDKKKDTREARFRLVAGRHRLEAVRKLGLAHIEAFISAKSAAQNRIWEIEENLVRAELTELEKGEHLGQLKDLHEQLHPETQHGGDRASRKIYDLKNPRFTKAMAKLTGKSESSIQKAIRRSEKIAPEVKERIARTAIANKGVELDRLADLSPEEQSAVVQKYEGGKATSIRGAIAQVCSAKACRQAAAGQTADATEGAGHASDKRQVADVLVVGPPDQVSERREIGAEFAAPNFVPEQPRSGITVLDIIVEKPDGGADLGDNDGCRGLATILDPLEKVFDLALQPRKGRSAPPISIPRNDILHVRDQLSRLLGWPIDPLHGMTGKEVTDRLAANDFTPKSAAVKIGWNNLVSNLKTAAAKPVDLHTRQKLRPLYDILRSDRAAGGAGAIPQALNRAAEKHRPRNAHRALFLRIRPAARLCRAGLPRLDDVGGSN
jgi:ParB family transcriptional regulator, chromosome partitioning protein